MSILFAACFLIFTFTYLVNLSAVQFYGDLVLCHHDYCHIGSAITEVALFAIVGLGWFYVLSAILKPKDTPTVVVVWCLAVHVLYSLLQIGKSHGILFSGTNITWLLADNHDEEAAAIARAKRSFKKFTYRGVDLEQLLDMSTEQLVDLVHSRARRRFQRGLKRKPMGLIKKLRKAKKDAPQFEKPAVVKTHLRNMIIVPEMIGSVIGIYNGKTFNQVEIKAEMVGHYLGEFSITYKPVRHGRPGIGATNSSRFVPLK